MTICGTCDQPIHLEHDSIFGTNWVHHNHQPACIPRNPPAYAYNQFNSLVATPHRNDRKRSEYKLVRARETT